MPTPRKPAPPRRATALRGRPRRRANPLDALLHMQPVPDEPAEPQPPPPPPPFELTPPPAPPQWIRH